MGALELSGEEQAWLRDLLDATYRAKLHEIHHTDRRAFKAALRCEAELIEELSRRLARLEPPRHAARR